MYYKAYLRTKVLHGPILCCYLWNAKIAHTVRNINTETEKLEQTQRFH